MKYFNNITNIVLVAVMCLAVASCFEQRDRVYDGPPVVEFFPQDMSANENSGEVQVEVQLIGEQRGEPTSVNFAVDDSATSAQPGDYEITTGSPVTIPANSSGTTITVALNGTEIPEDDFRQLTLRLDGGDVEAAENLRFFDLSIIGQ